MNFNAYSPPMRRAFTLLELLCTIAIIAILAALLLPVLEKGMGKARRASCSNNLRNVGTAFHAWAHDHGDLFPMQVSTNQHGTREFAEAAALNPDLSFTFRHFQALSNDLAVPSVLRCPADKQRIAAQDFALLDNTNVSYFVNVGAAFGRTDSPIAGDRNVRTSGRTEWTFVQIAPGNAVEFSAELHGHRGNVLFGDAHVSLYDGASLLAAFASSGSSNTGDTTLSLPRQNPDDGSSATPGASGAAAGTANSAGSATDSSEKYGEPKTPGPGSGSSNAATTAATTPSGSPRNPGGGVGRIVAGDTAPVVYTRLDGTLATSAPPAKVTNATAGERPRGEETILTPANPLLEFGQWLTRQSARYTYWLLFLLLAVMVTLEIIRRRARRQRKVSVED
jgi:prepilin-type N-terminal cleavage/methylation domain-containing protein/prepilin-type processing-associated H-X9-DG protein